MVRLIALAIFTALLALAGLELYINALGHMAR
jgi:hypothetical protein